MRQFTKKEAALLSSNIEIRTQSAKKSFYIFFLVYFKKYISSTPALFQKEMIDLAEDRNITLLSIMSFPDSGKTTILNLAFSIWNIISDRETHHIAIMSGTLKVSAQYIKDIKSECSKNRLLQKDFGVYFYNDKTVFLGQHSCIFQGLSQSSSNYIKRQGQNPDIIICDDIENFGIQKNEKYGRKIYDSFKKNIYPLSLSGTKVIILGQYSYKESFQNILHTDISEGKIQGSFKEYPIIKKNLVLWKERYGKRKINYLEKRLAKEIWSNDYLLTEMDYSDDILDKIEVIIVT